MNTTGRFKTEADIGTEQDCFWPLAGPRMPAPAHIRSHSLNDIDCTFGFRHLSECHDHNISSSSETALEAAARTVTYPLAPPLPFIHRRPTPPGLPSFGTREAQELRLVPHSRLYRIGKHLQNRFRNTENDAPVQDLQGTAEEPVRQEMTARRPHTEFDGPAELLRRMLGTTRLVTVETRSNKPRRVPLPRGVKIAAVPGDLAQAEDGTQVRGRFGNRASGHGVGSRTLNIHPLSRLRESSGLQEAVREIEKACRREQEQAAGLEPESSWVTITNDQSESVQDLCASDGSPEIPPQRAHTSSILAERSLNLLDLEALSAARALESEKRALATLEAQRQENVRLRAALKRHRTTSTGQTLQVAFDFSDHVIHSNSSDYHTPQEADDPMTTMPAASSPNFTSSQMLEPEPYASMSPRSGSGPGSGSSSPRPAYRGRRSSMPTMETMLADQERHLAIDERRARFGRDSEAGVIGSYVDVC